jgi:hypothetical protein
MASKTSRKEWVRGLRAAFGVGRQDRKRVHSASERSVGYVFLIEESVQNHPTNPHPYQTASKVAAKIPKEKDGLLAYFEITIEHWAHRNMINVTSAPVRARTGPTRRRSRGRLGVMVFKPLETAEER